MLNNLIYIYASQALTLLSPTLIHIFIARLFGAYEWGEVVTFTVYSQILYLFIDYGLHISAQKDIVKSLEYKKLRKNVGVIQSAKLIATFIVFFFSMVLYFFLNQKKEINFFYLLTYSISVGTIPSWYYKGLEKFKFFSVIEIVSKLLLLLICFFFLNKNSGILFYIHVLTLVTLSESFFLNFLIFVRLKHRLFFREGFSYLKSSFAFFKINFIGNIYPTLPVLIIGGYWGNEQVGFYSASEKIIKSIISAFIEPVKTLLIPYFIKLKNYSLSVEERLKLKKLLFYFLICSIFLSLVIFFFADKIIVLLFGKNFFVSIKLLKILSVLPFLYCLHNFYVILGLICSDKEKTVFKLVFFALLLFLILSLMVFLFKLSDFIIIPIIWVLVELFIDLFSYLLLKYNSNKSKYFLKNIIINYIKIK